MKNLLKYIAVFLLALTAFNCSKDEDNDAAENIRLKTYGINANEYDITYNAEGKPSGFETSSGNNIIIYNNNNQIIQMGNTTYTYNSQGRIATVNTINTSRTINSTVTYNNDGQVAVINATNTNNSGSSNSSTTTMEYEGTKLKTIKEYQTNLYPNYTKLTLEYDSNNNISQILISKSSDDISYENRTMISYTYDTKINPFYHALTKTGINSEINMLNFVKYYYLASSAFEGLKYYSKNNILTSQVIFILDGSTDTNTYDYVYNKNNLPISAEHQLNYSSTGESGTLYYIWTYETL